MTFIITTERIIFLDDKVKAAIQPFIITTETDKTVIEWRFDSFSVGQIESPPSSSI